MSKSRSGFTIVELLIVIIVIAILATISTVAYAGIQNRSHDMAVQSDLSQLKNKIEVFYIDNNRYPSSHADLISFQFKRAISSYQTDGLSYNLLLCNPYDAPTKQFNLVARSKSGTVYRIAHDIGGVEEYSGIWRESQSDMCIDLGSPPAYGSQNFRGYAPEDITTGPWRTWAGGN